VSGGEFAPPSAAERAARDVHTRWWEQRIQRQKEIDASIAAKADFEYLYDKPIPDKTKIRVAGPFTVESISPPWRKADSLPRSVTFSGCCSPICWRASEAP